MSTAVGFHIPRHAATSAARGVPGQNLTRGGTLHHNENDNPATKKWPAVKLGAEGKDEHDALDLRPKKKR